MQRQMAKSSSVPFAPIGDSQANSWKTVTKYNNPNKTLMTGEKAAQIQMPRTSSSVKHAQSATHS